MNNVIIKYPGEIGINLKVYNELYHSLEENGFMPVFGKKSYSLKSKEGTAKFFYFSDKPLPTKKNLQKILSGIEISKIKINRKKN